MDTTIIHFAIKIIRLKRQFVCIQKMWPCKAGVWRHSGSVTRTRMVFLPTSFAILLGQWLLQVLSQVPSQFYKRGDQHRLAGCGWRCVKRGEGLPNKVELIWPNTDELHIRHHERNSDHISSRIGRWDTALLCKYLHTGSCQRALSWPRFIEWVGDHTQHALQNTSRFASACSDEAMSDVHSPSPFFLDSQRSRR